MHPGAMEPFADDDASTLWTDSLVAPDPQTTRPSDIELWKARKHYPSTLVAGGPVFGAARERGDGTWEVLPYFAGRTPQDARDELGAHFRALARLAQDTGGTAAAADYLAAADRLDTEAVDELTAGGHRHRVIRAERFLRMGPDGPEPPRVTDPDPGGPGDPATTADPAAGLIVTPGSAPESVLTAELLAAVARDATVPDDAAQDARHAVRSHPGVLPLPATFMTAERSGHGWRPASAGIAPTPQAARDGLAVQLRVLFPWQRELTAEEREIHKRAADRLDTERVDELDVADRHFRIVRVERVLRVGPDGPEGPRPSDLTEDHGPFPAPDDEDEGLPYERLTHFLDLVAEERRRRGGTDGAR